MARRLQGRVRYDEQTDSFIYEVRHIDEVKDEYGDVIDEDVSDWGFSLAAKCYRREGAEDGEDTNFIHFDFMKKIVRDAWLYDVELMLARQEGE